MDRKRIIEIGKQYLKGFDVGEEGREIFTNGIADIVQYFNNANLDNEESIRALCEKLRVVSSLETVEIPIGENPDRIHTYLSDKYPVSGHYEMTENLKGLDIVLSSSVVGWNRESSVEMFGRLALAEVLSEKDLVDNKSLNAALIDCIGKAPIDAYQYLDTGDNDYLGNEIKRPEVFRGDASERYTSGLYGDISLNMTVIDKLDTEEIAIQHLASTLMNNESFVRSYLLGESTSLDIQKISDLCTQYENTRDIKYILQAERITLEHAISQFDSSATEGDLIRFYTDIRRPDKQDNQAGYQNRLNSTLELIVGKEECEISVSDFVLQDKIITEIYARRNPDIDIEKELNPITRSMECSAYLLAIQAIAEVGIKDGNDFDSISLKTDRNNDIVVSFGSQKVKVSGHQLENGMMVVDDMVKVDFSSRSKVLVEALLYNIDAKDAFKEISDEWRMSRNGVETCEISQGEVQKVKEAIMTLEEIVDKGEHSLRLLMDNPEVLRTYSPAMLETIIEDGIANTDFSLKNEKGENILHLLISQDDEISSAILSELKINHTAIYVRLLNEENYMGNTPHDYIVARDEANGITIEKSHENMSDMDKNIEVESGKGIEDISSNETENASSNETTYEIE